MATQKTSAKQSRSTVSESKFATHRMRSNPMQKPSSGAKQKAIDAMLKGMRGGGKKEISGK